MRRLLALFAIAWGWLVAVATVLALAVWAIIHPTPPPPPTPTCPADPLIGVYSPSRLTVLGTCETYAGTVYSVRHELDGDYHVDVLPDSGFEPFLNQGNYTNQHGALVTEIMPAQDAQFRIPIVGEHLVLLGTWVYDTYHGWNEIHPIFAITYGNSTKAVSIPAPLGARALHSGDPRG